MADFENNGTEAPTPKRREDARLEGQVAQSPDLTGAAALLTGCFLVLWFGSAWGHHLLSGVRMWVESIDISEWTVWHSQTGASWLTSELTAITGFFVLTLMAIGLMTGFLQVGFVISFKPLEIDFEKLMPSKGWSRVMSMESGIRGLQGAFKVSALLIVSSSVLWTYRDRLSVRNFSTVGSVVAEAWDLGLLIALILAGIAFGIALFDYFIRWMRHEQQLKMTREEIKQEQKDDTGDPHMRAAIRKRQRDARRRQSVKDVPLATVVLTNPTHLAVAIQYEAGKMSAPKVVAKGAGIFAKNIVRIARENNVPVLERKPIARALFASVEVGEHIPFEYFRAIAEIIAQIYRAKGGRTAA
ncbi:MAG: EscU/YscU/HrcU family type III secretion system export apparatus switch protein [Planctomyces sp.]|nr:EscU/YscU/HrcU family type III secretion system export apparatus switch protein [Planctomyces sp.]